MVRGGAERDLLRAFDRVPMERHSFGPAAAQHCLGLSRSFGSGTARSPLSTMRFTLKAASAGREASPSAAILDAQSQTRGALARPVGLRCRQEGPRPQASRPRRYAGPALNVAVHAADIQDRDGAETLLRQARRRFPFVERIYADGGYTGAKSSSTHRRMDNRDRQAQRHRSLRRPAQTMDRRTYARLDQSQPPPLPRLRATQPHRRRLRPTRNDPHHAQAYRTNLLSLNPNFSDGLLGKTCDPGSRRLHLPHGWFAPSSCS